MKNLLLFLSIVVLVSSCAGKKDKPENILPQKKMQAVMWDIMRAEEFLHNYVIYRDTSVDKAAETKKWYDKVFELHKITKKDFDRSYAYYNAHPAMMKELLDSISKKPAPAPPGQSATHPTDTLAKNDTVSFFNKKRIMDSLGRKRVLKKISTP